MSEWLNLEPKPQRVRRFVRAVRRVVVRALCRHPTMRFNAATAAQPLPDGSNVTVGVVAICNRCGRQWVGDVVAGKPVKLHAFTTHGLRVVR